jgi:hypothetical protein
LLRRRSQAELKYSPSQPRIPAGQTGGGRWTRDGGDVATSLEAAPAATPDLARPMGHVDLGATAGAEGSGLFQIAPSTPDRSGVRLAGDLPVDLAEEEQQGGMPLSSTSDEPTNS